MVHIVNVIICYISQLIKIYFQCTVTLDDAILNLEHLKLGLPTLRLKLIKLISLYCDN